jgi:hypothetical protein
MAKHTVTRIARWCVTVGLLVSGSAIGGDLANGGATLTRDLGMLQRAVAAFRDVRAAEAAGFAPALACRVGPDGSQGVHYVSAAPVSGGQPVVEAPQRLLYEPWSGGLRHVGVAYLVDQAAWHGAGHVDPPSLFGQPFRRDEHLLGAPTYVLVVWVPQVNPSGIFSDWNPLVSCALRGTDGRMRGDGLP